MNQSQPVAHLSVSGAAPSPSLGGSPSDARRVWRLPSRFVCGRADISLIRSLARIKAKRFRLPGARCPATDPQALLSKPHSRLTRALNITLNICALARARSSSVIPRRPGLSRLVRNYYSLPSRGRPAQKTVAQVSWAPVAACSPPRPAPRCDLGRGLPVLHELAPHDERAGWIMGTATPRMRASAGRPTARTSWPPPIPGDSSSSSSSHIHFPSSPSLTPSVRLTNLLELHEPCARLRPRLR
ncbi:hypothetical protein FA95DRAFT_955135 [Auriscalpium vulgare]|uniref:Uncharacterized protein n=1 Tax=Auriscalpium vulgare TaxID=40419 RepID=A0ACB8R8M7_9AGAM|nr:hypothetical protein FA95DRAFT_955135 [Auriscalpium vulgare]